MTGRLAGKTAIISGAGQTPGETLGNGRAMALLFAKEGARLLCTDRILERAEETAAMVVKEGGQASALKCDITKSAEVAAMVAEAKDRLGRIDILVNNVGIGGGDGPAHKVEEDAFDRVINVNLKGTWLMTKAVLGVMREQKSGSIVNISSLAPVYGLRSKSVV